MLQNRDNFKIQKLKILKLRNKYMGKSCQLFYKNDPLKITHGKGAYMFDERGNRYLDGVNNVAHVGHCQEYVVKAGTVQMSQLATNNRFLHHELTQFCEKIADLMPSNLSVVFFTNSGSEANDLALRLARARTNGKGIIAMDYAYHGHLISLMKISPYKYKSAAAVTSYCPNDSIRIVPSPDVYNGQYNSNHMSKRLAGKLYAGEVRKAIQDLKRQGTRVAGFIAESYQSCGGQIFPPKPYYKKVYQYLKDVGGVTIADEVQTGYARMGSHFCAFQKEQVRPQIVTLAKAIGNGHPVGIVITTEEIAESFAATGVSYFNTYGGNPVSCAILNAVLNAIEKEKLQQNALITGRFLLKRLKKLKQKFKIIGDVRGAGLFIGIELVKDRSTREPAGGVANWMSFYMKSVHRVLVSVDGPNENVLKLKPPLVFSIEEAEAFLSAFQSTLEELNHPIHAFSLVVTKTKQTCS